MIKNKHFEIIAPGDIFTDKRKTADKFQPIPLLNFIVVTLIQAANQSTDGWEGYQVLHRPMETEGSMLPLLNDRDTYGMESWQRVYSRKNKKSLSPGWHFFGREWDFKETAVRQSAYSTDDDHSKSTLFFVLPL